jgi:L-fucose isomerase-like protein
MTRCTYEVVAAPLHDRSAIETAARFATAALRASGGEAGPPQPNLPHVVVVGSGGTESIVLELLDRRDDEVRAPALLVAHPKHNSLPAALESLARLHQLGRRGRIVFIPEGGDVDIPDGADPSDVGARQPGNRELDEAIQDVTAWHRLHRTRLGLVGTPSEWLVASTPTSDVVRARWGPELVDVSIESTLERYEAVPVEIGTRAAARFGGTPADRLPPPHDVVRAARLHPALEQIIADDDLDAITVRCFDFLGSIETSGCVALAQLNDDGVVAGCEGDVPAALAMLWARSLLDQVSWIANPASVDPASNSVVLAHCTIAPSLVDELHLSSHFESGIGVGVHGRLRTGDVTLIRLGGAQLDRCWIADGRVVGTGDDPDLCRTQAVVELVDRDVGDLLTDPLGNHLVVIEGAHRARLERWWNWAVSPCM